MEDNELSLTGKDLEERLLNEVDSDEVRNIIDLFNLNIKKKNVIRTGKLSELQDAISQQMIERVEKNADAFSNKDLLDYFRTIQQTLSASDTSSDNIKVPVQIMQNQINVNVDNNGLNRESKLRVIEAIKSIMNKQNRQVVDVEYTAIDDEPEYNEWETYIGE